MVGQVKDKSRNNKYTYAVVLSVVLVLGVVLLSLFVIKPLFADAQKVTKEVKDKKTELTKLQDKKAKLEALKDKEEELKKQAATISNALPESKDIGRLFIQINDIATGSGGTVKSVAESGSATAGATTTATPTTQTTFGNVQQSIYTIPIDFGSYFDWKNFVTKTETALRLVSIGDFTVNATDSGTMTSSVTITTYTRN